jgi:hypothetical protein
MFIDRSFSNIATTRIGYLKCTKSLQKSRKEEYTDSDLFHEIDIEIFHIHLSCVEFEGISFEYDDHT